MRTADDIAADLDLQHNDRAWADTERVDLTYHDGAGPVLLVYAADGSRHRHVLTPAETYAIVRRLVGWLGYFHPAGTATLQSPVARVAGDDRRRR